MSGIEVIGVLLGLYPIVLNACQLYKATRSGEGYEKLIRRLEVERFLFDDFVSRLLGPDVPNELGRLKTSVDPVAWKEDDLQAKLERRHGFIKTKYILSIISDSNDVLHAIQTETETRSFLKQRSRLRFAFRNILSDPTFSTLLSQLKEYNQTLRLLLSDQTTPSSTGSCRQPLPPLEFTQRDPHDAQNLYKAICNGYHCDCHLPHYANIEVPHLNNVQNLAWPRGKTEEKRLQILFPIVDNTESITDGLATVSIQEKSNAVPPPPNLRKSALRLSRSDMANFTRTNTSFLKSASRKSHAISVRECADDQKEPIPDLCNFVKTFNGSDRTPGASENELGILQSENKKYRLQSPGSQYQETRDTVSLDEFTNSEKSLLSRGDRISLAVRLAYAIIQYYSTGWIDSDWTWKDFSISGNEYRFNDLSQLFVAQKFYSSANKAPKRTTWVGWESLGEPRLTRLGFALIELAMGQRLSEMRDATIDPKADPDAQDYWTAIRLLNTGRILREEGEGYENVVKACIFHQYRDENYTMKYLDSRDDNFHQDVEQCVLKVLYCMWKEPFSGHSQRRLCF